METSEKSDATVASLQLLIPQAITNTANLQGFSSTQTILAFVSERVTNPCEQLTKLVRAAIKRLVRTLKLIQRGKYFKLQNKRVTTSQTTIVFPWAEPRYKLRKPNPKTAKPDFLTTFPVLDTRSPTELVQLDPKGETYQKVYDLVRLHEINTGRQPSTLIRITKIERVQNPELLQDFSESADASLYDRWMWHGTSEANAECILETGYDTRKCLRGGPYIYLAEAAHISIHYAFQYSIWPNPRGVLILNRVALGDKPILGYAESKLTKSEVLALQEVERIYPTFFVTVEM